MKITDEMCKTMRDHLSRWPETDEMRAALAAVAPLIEAQARADAIEEAIVALNGIDGPSWHDDGSFGLAMERGEKAIRALLSPRPVSQGAGA